jgi:UDP-N-acetylglucosamine 2-epimerase
MIKLCIVVGTRPQIIKAAPIVKAAGSLRKLKVSIIHTGQHYDYEMSRIFFSELNLPKPSANLEVGSAPDVLQIARIMMKLDSALTSLAPDIVIVPGDTNSALAAGLGANKLHMPVAHVEAGARSYESSLPEEINRRLIDHVSTLLFTPTSTCSRNLRMEGIHRRVIHQTGDTMLDLFMMFLKDIRSSDFPARLGLIERNFVLLTVHRQATVENKAAMSRVVNAILRLHRTKFVFPVHPHTMAKLEEFHLLRKLRDAHHVQLLDPVGYVESLALAKKAQLVVCDSGGLQKESYWVGTPCVTLREKTEWPETTKRQANILVGTQEEKIVYQIKKALSHPKEIKLGSNPFGDGHASYRIVSTLLASRDLLLQNQS